MRKNPSEVVFTIDVVGLGLFVVIFRQAWRLSHRGGYPLFSIESWQHMKWWLLIALVIFLIGIVFAAFKNSEPK